jgi:hypothetical protein
MVGYQHLHRTATISATSRAGYGSDVQRPGTAFVQSAQELHGGGGQDLADAQAQM